MTVHAPFNFVPLPKRVYFPDWADQVSHDRPFADGLCGELSLELTNHTPLLVAGHSEHSCQKRPFKLPDDRYAIPGSSLRQMLRSVIEIAAFGKMERVNDRKGAVRDLQGYARSFYGTYFVNQITRNDASGNPRNAYLPRAKSGWLSFINGAWQLRWCEHARVEQDDLDTCLADTWFKSHRPATPPAGWHYPAAHDKYECLVSKRPSLEVDFDCTNELAQRHSNNKWLCYRKVTTLGSGKKRGHLVMTGQPSGKKHMEFIFEAPGNPIGVDAAVFRDFVQIHKDTPEWRFMMDPDRNPFPPDHGIPVFYLEKNNAVTAIGLAQLFKLPHALTVPEAIRNTSPEHACVDRIDLAGLIFGQGNDDGTGLKGRANVSLAVSEDAKLDPNCPPQGHAVILNQPEFGYYPIYVVQKNLEPGGNGGQLKIKQHKNGNPIYMPYTTLMDKHAEIRGWKRFQVREQIDIPALDHEQKTSDSVSYLFPLAKSTFRATLRFHNLRPEELGALVWAVEWGGRTELRHALGSGKPFGMGSVELKITDAALRANNGRAVTTWRAELDTARARFVSAMNAFEPVWANTPQLKTLTSLADPAKAKGQVLHYMKMDIRNRHLNEFLQARVNGKVLPNHA